MERFCVRSLVLIAVFSVSFAGQLLATQFQFQSATTQTSLLELYTSEGCSSCPPAESWLTHQKNSAGLWKTFAPVAFHVHYWDYLGWKDPWADRRFSDRQQDYARTWRSDEIYTPEFVLNGTEWPNWHRSKDVPPSSRNAGVLTVSSTNRNDWEVTFKPVASQDRYEVHVALLASGLSSDVRSGENRGRRLTHDFVAVTLVERPLVKQGETFSGTVKISPPKKTLEGRIAIVVWVTLGGQNKPIQATGGWLPPNI